MSLPSMEAPPLNSGFPVVSVLMVEATKAMLNGAGTLETISKAG